MQGNRFGSRWSGHVHTDTVGVLCVFREGGILVASSAYSKLGISIYIIINKQKSRQIIMIKQTVGGVVVGFVAARLWDGDCRLCPGCTCCPAVWSLHFTWCAGVCELCPADLP